MSGPVHISEVVSQVLARLPQAARQRVDSMPQQVRTKMRIEQANACFESLADLNPRPESWATAMQALIAGAVDYDDIEPLLKQCSYLADNAAKLASPQEHEFAITWDRIAFGLIEIAKACCDVAPLNSTTLAETYLKMGRAADVALQSGAVS